MIEFRKSIRSALTTSFGLSVSILISAFLYVAASASDIIVPKFAMKSPGYIVSHSWSHDSRHIALLVWTPPVYILDVTDQRLTATTVADVPITNVALSNDAKLLATTAPNEVRLYSTNNGRLLRRAVAPTPTCSFSDYRNATFVPSTGDLWISCGRSRPVQNVQRTAALQLAVPQLDITASVEIPASDIISWRSKLSTDLAGDSPIMLALAGRLLVDPKSARRFSYYTLECMRLDIKEQCFEPLALEEQSANPLAVWALTSDLNRAAISGNAQEIDIYDTNNTKPSHKIRISPAQHLSGLSFIRNGTLLIGGSNDSKLGKGGIVVWDAIDGSVVQAIGSIPVVQMSVSPDGSKLLLITDKKIIVYGITAK